MNRHQIDEEENEVVPDHPQSDLIDDLVQATEIKIETEIGIDHESIHEETGQDLDLEEDLVPEIGGVVVVEIEAEIDIDIEKVADTIEHRLMNQMR